MTKDETYLRGNLVEQIVSVFFPWIDFCRAAHVWAVEVAEGKKKRLKHIFQVHKHAVMIRFPHFIY